MRRVFRAVFAKLASQNWTEPAISEYIELLKHTLISSTSNICESLKYHCASIYLDELDNAGNIAKCHYGSPLISESNSAII